MRDTASGSPAFGTAAAFSTAAPFDTAAIAADAVALAELDGGTGHEEVRIDWLRRRLADAPGHRHVDDAGNLVWTFGPRPYRLALLVHVDDANAALAAGIPAIALGCCEGEDMHVPTERIRADSIGAGAGQLRAVLAEIMERNP